MRKILCLLVLMVAVQFASKAQNMKELSKLADAKVIVMVNTADWCPICKANRSRVEMDIFSKFKADKKYAFVINDLSNAGSIANSKKGLSSLGLTNIASKNKATGVIYFIDPISRKVKSQISMAESNDAIKSAFAKAL